MVKRKVTRQLPKSKPQKPDVSILDDDDEERKENLKKRLDDFDMQVKDIIQKMEKDKDTCLKSIKHLYFVDEQRTSTDINSLLWTQYLKQNTPCPQPAIRKSIAELINSVEDKTKINAKRKKKESKIVAEDTSDVSTRTTRATRSRNKSVLTELNLPNNETPLSTATQAKRGKSRSKIVQSTPLNQGLLPPSTLLITPKFDPRTPLPLSSMRKPRMGEIAVSLKGSPLQVSLKNSLDKMLDTELDTKTKEQLQELHQKVAKLLDM